MSDSKPNQVRIISGKWRGRKIHFPSTEQLRPSSDRIRETAFNWLQFRLSSTSCLDLYAGSGACGFEALSRGASSVTLIDSDPVVCQSLQQTKALFQAYNAEIVCESIPSDRLADKLNGQQFDVVFIDPPFHQNMISPACAWLADIGVMAEGGVAYIETEASLQPLPIPEHWEILKAKKAGNVAYYLVNT